MLNFCMPVKVISGEDSVKKNAVLLKEFGKKALLVTGAESAKRCGAFQDVTEALESQGISWVLFDGICENPLLSACREAGMKASEAGAEFIFGIGGGSPMDAAKAVSVFAANPGISEEDFYDKKWNCKPLPIVLAGTTAGTGSEVTDVSVLTDSKAKKHSIHDPLLYAKLSFGDPRYTASMPLRVTLSTGIDVLAHSAESYFSKKANEISRAASIGSISLLYAPLMKAAKGDDLTISDREKLYEASILGGLAISVTGTCFPHNMGYYLTENFRVPHGMACAVFLPDLFTWVREAVPDCAGEFYERLGIPEDALLSLIAAALPAIPVRLTDEEISAILPRWENNNSVKNTVGEVSTEKIREILLKHFLM